MEIVAYLVNPGFPLNIGVHRFAPGTDGQLEHWIDGDLRAVVPPEGWKDYAVQWPACEPVVRSLTIAPASSKAPTAPPL